MRFQGGNHKTCDRRLVSQNAKFVCIFTQLNFFVYTTAGESEIDFKSKWKKHALLQTAVTLSFHGNILRAMFYW